MSYTEPRIREINAQYHRARNWLLWLVLVGFAVNGALFYAVLRAEPSPPLMQFTEAASTGATALCPGDTLHYMITLHVSEAGVFDLDTAVWRVSPSATVFFSQTRRMVFDGPADYTLARTWIVPHFYSSAVDGSPERWAAGAYVRRHAISTTSRSTEPSIIAIPFSIRSDCP